jgi:hypothetical protein
MIECNCNREPIKLLRKHKSVRNHYVKENAYQISTLIDPPQASSNLPKINSQWVESVKNKFSKSQKSNVYYIWRETWGFRSIQIYYIFWAFSFFSK